jgi:hypothetical protein
MSADPITVDELPAWFVEHEQRLSAVEAELQFLKNLWVLSSFAVRLPRTAVRDPRVIRRPRKRPRQGGHL